MYDFLASNRFLQRMFFWFVIESKSKLILGLENIDPHYKIIGYVSTDTNQEIDLVTIIM
jgi:hypothetical protein